MSDQSSSLELARRDASAELERPLPPMNDAEVAGAWRTAKALADSGLFPDVRSAGQAFAKMLAGRDLGLTAYESMDALDVIEGSIVATADLHATKVRQRPGYDFRVVWLRCAHEWNGEAWPPPNVEGVPAEDEDPADLRPYCGCAITFTVGGKRRGVSRWTLEDSKRAGLLERRGPGGGPGMHKRYPRSMYFARAMSQGVSLFVPEVMRGLRVYVREDFAQTESGHDLGAGERAGETVAMDALPTAVEAVIARARELGHAGLSNRQAVAEQVAGQPEARIVQWVARATRELNRVGRGHAPTSEPEPPDAEVVPERCGVEFGAGEDGDPRPARCELPKGHDGQHVGPMVTPTQNEPVSASEGAGAPESTPEATDAAEAQREPHEAQESAEVVDGDVEMVVAAPAERAEQLRAIAVQLLEDADTAEAEGQPEEADRLRASATETVAEADALADPAQSELEL